MRIRQHKINNVYFNSAFILHVVGCWHGYLSGARCRLAYSPADATATHCLLRFSKVQIGFTYLVPADPGSPGQRAVKQVCVRRTHTCARVLFFMYWRLCTMVSETKQLLINN